MTAVALPDIDRSTLAELRDRMPSLEHAGRDADRAIDRVLRRSRPPMEELRKEAGHDRLHA
jgi:hypothetical protein